MLLSMQQQNATTPSAAAANFAGLLAALTAPSPSPRDSFDDVPLPGKKPAQAWNDDDLADDVATLSYERALRAHARYRSPAVADQTFTPSVEPEPTEQESVQPAFPQQKEGPASPFVAAAQTGFRPAADPEPAPLRAGIFERNLKDASITIRVSKAECAQLHQRAAEAGLTVSAYLRFCTFEAESLRAEVKRTLMDLKTGATQAQPARLSQSSNPEPRRRSWFGRLTGWLAHLLTPWNSRQRMARA